MSQRSHKTFEINVLLTFFLIMDPDPLHWFLNIYILAYGGNPLAAFVAHTPAPHPGFSP